MTERTLHSSVLAELAYDSDRQQLRLRFHDGSLYLYHDVPSAVVVAMLAAPSCGRYFNEHIRGQFASSLLS